MNRSFYKNPFLAVIAMSISLYAAARTPDPPKCKQDKPNDLMDESLKGKVKEVITQEYFIDSLAQKHSYRTQTYYYDTSGMWIERRWDFVLDHPVVSRIWKRIYSAHGGLIKEIYYKADSSEYTETDKVKDNTKKYDAWGRLIEQDQYGSKGVYKYKDSDNSVSFEQIDDDKVAQKIDDLYDDKCRIIEQRDTTDYRTGKKTYTYDDKGNLTEILEVWNQKNDYGSCLTRFKYDDHGGQIERSDYYERKDSLPFSTLYRTAYKYDDKGNWISQEGISTGGTLNLDFKNERQIIYY